MGSSWRFAVAGVVAAGVMAVTGTAVAGAEPAKRGSDTFADRTVTRDVAGWKVALSKRGERVRSVPPLNQSPWTREGFLDLGGELVISGRGTVPIDAAVLETGYTVACNTDVTSGVSLGGTFGGSATIAVTYPPALMLGVQAMPNISTTLRPGTTVEVPFAQKRARGATAATILEGVHLKVDGCLGPVAVRAWARRSVGTAALDRTFNVYGKPHYL
ncbi:MAG: MspA family porin [Gordonia sp. (in: high G+C Gram-positive bacteria)]